MEEATRTIQPGTGARLAREGDEPRQRSGRAFRPIQEIRRVAATAGDAATELERYKVSLRRYAAVQKGLAGLPWEGEWLCGHCGQTTPGRLRHEPVRDAIKDCCVIT